MVEPLLSGIVLGLVVMTLGGLFYKAYEQYKRDSKKDDAERQRLQRLENR